MKISIVYFSLTGNTRAAAEVVAGGIRGVSSDIEVRCFDLESVDDAFLAESCAVVFGTPTYAAGPCWQIKQWFDTYRGANLGGKLGSAFSTANYIQGGADTSLLSVISCMVVRGMLAFSGGASLGQPFIHLGAVSVKDHEDECREMFRIFGERIANKAKELFA